MNKLLHFSSRYVGYFFILVILLICSNSQAKNKKIIMFGIDHVIFKPDLSNIPGGWLGYMIGYTPSAIENDLFATIWGIPHPQTQHRQSTGPYSPILCHWLTVPNSSTFVREKSIEYINQNTSLLRKTRLSLAAGYAFNPEKMAGVLKPNSDLLPIIHAVKRAGHHCIIASNWNQECFYALVKTHKSFLPLFETAYISGHLGYLTYEKPFFNKIVAELQATPKDCILIDSRYESLMGAKKAGIKIITYNTGNQVMQELKQLHVI